MLEGLSQRRWRRSLVAAATHGGKHIPLYAVRLLEADSSTGNTGVGLVTIAKEIPAERGKWR